MDRIVSWWDRFQIPLYLVALIAGAVIGSAFSGSAEVFEAAINPSLILLLYATFLSIPIMKLGSSLKDLKFLSALLLVNFLIVPAVVFILSRFFLGNDAVLIGFTLVMLAPCIDYVIVFSGLAGASQGKLLAATPILMGLQIVVIPIFLSLFVGTNVLGEVSWKPFANAFFFLILIPLVAAAITQKAMGKYRAAQSISNAAEAFMVPLMIITLFVVVASQFETVTGNLSELLAVIPLYIAFLVIMVPIGMVVSTMFKLSAPDKRAIVFSGATRNSLVVLPLALALPEQLQLATVIVVTQTLVELIGMVIYVKLMPQLIK